MDLIFTNDFCLEQKFEKEKYINKLENTIIRYNQELLNGIAYVDDATYTNCIELLNLLCPESPVLRNDKDVKFIKSLDEDNVEYLYEVLKDIDTLKFYLNPQGLNVRLIYEYGELTSAVTFGRSFKNKDVLDIMKMIMTDRNDFLSDLSYVEVEGTLVLSKENLDMASEFCSIQNPYQGVFAFINFVVSMEEYQDDTFNYEDVVWFIATDIEIKDLPFNSLEDKYDYLTENGFLVPEQMEVERNKNLSYDLEYILDLAEMKQSDYPYLTDGFRLIGNSNDVILFKIGYWNISYSEGIVDSIEWIDKKSKKLPVLKLREPVRIMDDSVEEKDSFISEIVLNNINLLLILNIEIDESVRFAYFGDMGILPITEKNEIILN